jgi:phage repressor protein C with HTH and peptisase S24 domain
VTPLLSRPVLPWQRVLVAGPSMVPALTHGDLLLVRRGAAVRPGDIVLARFATMPGRLVVKRADHPLDAGWFVRSDNEFAGGDSTVHGPATVLGRAVLRRPAGSRTWRRIRSVGSAG